MTTSKYHNLLTEQLLLQQKVNTLSNLANNLDDSLAAQTSKLHRIEAYVRATMRSHISSDENPKEAVHFVCNGVLSIIYPDKDHKA
jgi:hypothetical protein